MCVWGGSNNENKGGWSSQEEVPPQSPGTKEEKPEEGPESNGVCKSKSVLMCFLGRLWCNYSERLVLF